LIFYEDIWGGFWPSATSLITIFNIGLNVGATLSYLYYVQRVLRTPSALAVCEAYPEDKEVAARDAAAAARKGKSHAPLFATNCH
jgi:hypothetical protein